MPTVKKFLQKFPYPKMLATWNSLSIELKSTAGADDFFQMLKNNFLTGYSNDNHCSGPCYSCGVSSI